jgi:exopolyphosphatase/guanosine-5'-triphosphate,3'-diphosphate pyrophosphatase
MPRARGVDALARVSPSDCVDFDPGAVRAVATNTLRVAKNSRPVPGKGRSGAGVPDRGDRRTGRGPPDLSGCGPYPCADRKNASWWWISGAVRPSSSSARISIRFASNHSTWAASASACASFRTDKVDKYAASSEAELAARRELQTIVHHEFRETGWDEAIGSSGTAKAIVDLLELNGWSDHGLTREGHGESCAAALMRCRKCVGRLKLEGLASRPDSCGCLAGWPSCPPFSRSSDWIAWHFPKARLRLGVLYDLLGRHPP